MLEVVDVNTFTGCLVSHVNIDPKSLKTLIFLGIRAGVVFLNYFGCVCDLIWPKGQYSASVR